MQGFNCRAVGQHPLTELGENMAKTLAITLFLTPFAAGVILGLAFSFEGRMVDPTIALAALSTEAQVFAMFAALTPIFFLFAEFYRRETYLLRELTKTVVAIIAVSVLGTCLSILCMVTQFFLFGAIIFLLLMVVQVAVLMSLFLLTFARNKRVQNWITEPKRRGR
jgi:hypothetical protein